MSKTVIPAGWKLVPIEPTEEMLDAADKMPDVFAMGDEWRAMIAAAPDPVCGGDLFDRAGVRGVIEAAVNLVCSPSWAGISDEDCFLEQALRDAGFVRAASPTDQPLDPVRPDGHSD